MTSTEPKLDLPVFPWHRGCPYQPPAEYGVVRENQPITPVQLSTDIPAWVITRYDHVRQILTDPNASSDRAHEGFPYYIPVPSVFRTEASFIGYDPPVHTVHRRLAAISGEFTKARVTQMRPRIQQIVDERIEAMLAAGPPVDLVKMLALPVPLTVICMVLGIPHSDHDFLHARTDVLFGAASTAQQRGAALGEVNEYLGKLVDKRDQEPGDDLLSRIVQRYREEGLYDRRELVNVIRLLLNGGHETSAAMIALGTLTLLEHPDQLAKLKADFSLTPSAVEELLRFISPGDLATSRVALKDIEVGGVTIPAGQGMILLGASANRDPEAFPEPDRLDIERGARHHIAFGHGVHHCIGAEIARVELSIVIESLFRRIPTLRLAKPWNELKYKDGNVMYGVYEMPVTW